MNVPILHCHHTDHFGRYCRSMLPNACKKKENAVNPASLGLVGPPGPPGSQGVQGPQGPANPNAQTLNGLTATQIITQATNGVAAGLSAFLNSAYTRVATIIVSDGFCNTIDVNCDTVSDFLLSCGAASRTPLPHAPSQRSGGGRVVTVVEEVVVVEVVVDDVVVVVVAEDVVVEDVVAVEEVMVIEDVVVVKVVVVVEEVVVVLEDVVVVEVVVVGVVVELVVTVPTGALVRQPGIFPPRPRWRGIPLRFFCRAYERQNN